MYGEKCRQCFASHSPFMKIPCTFSHKEILPMHKIKSFTEMAPKEKTSTKKQVWNGACNLKIYKPSQHLLYFHIEMFPKYRN